MSASLTRTCVPEVRSVLKNACTQPARGKCSPIVRQRRNAADVCVRASGANGNGGTERAESWADGKRRSIPTPKKNGGAGKSSGGMEYGPQQPASKGGPDPDGLFAENPDWKLLLEEEALHDPEIADLLEGCEGDSKKIYDKIRTRFEARSQEIIRERQGREEGMKVEFREFDAQNLWIWLEMYDYPLENERKLLEEVIDAWFTLGHLGGYNCLNLQVLERGSDVSFMEYDLDKGIDSSQFALFHNMEEVEYKGNWSRFWVDMGSGDELSIDILINSLSQMSREYVGIKRIVVGGVNDDWKEDTEGRSGGDMMFRLGTPRTGPASGDFNF